MTIEPLVHVGYHKTASTWLQRRIFSDESLGYLEVRPRTIIDQAFIVCNPFRFDPEGRGIVLRGVGAEGRGERPDARHLA